MRILVGGIAHESNTFNPILTSIDSFQITSERELANEEPAKTLCSMGIDVAPTMYARALPSGTVDRDTYLSLKDQLLEQVEKTGRIDGACLILHGAMVVKDIGSAELDLLKSMREVLDEEVIISASLDLHGNIPIEMADYANILTAYRKTPHTDALETCKKAATLLVESLKRRVRPRPVIVRPPILVAGEYVVTDAEPAAGLYGMLSSVDSTPGIMDSSLLVGMAWADVSHAGASAITIAETREDLKKAREKAYEIARAYWEKRMELRLEAEADQPREVVRQAKASPRRPFFISDSGDNVTAGAAGDIPMMVEELVLSQVQDAVVGCIIDSEAVEACREAGVGASLSLKIGGRLDRVNGHPLEVRGRVSNLAGNGVVFRVDNVDIILTAKRTAFTSPQDFMAYGIDPVRRKIVVVKLGLLMADLKKIAAQSMIALTPGFTNLSTETLGYRNLKRPMFPLDRDFDWRYDATHE